jgi:transcriptional regulator with XRE-family HTH domain
MMPDLRTSPSHRALAAELRRLRDRAVLSGDEVASELHWSASKVSRIETNRIGIKIADLNKLLDLYNERSDLPLVDDNRRGQLIALASEPEPRGWWNGYADSIAPEYAAYISLEASASEIRCWCPEMIQGLLQTEEYANAIMEIPALAGSLTPGTKQRRIEVRMRRQDMIRTAEERQFIFILDEAALLHRYGDAEAMRRQLVTLNEVSQLPNVSIRVLALAGPHPVFGPGSFTLLQFAAVHGTQISDVVYIEQLTRNDFIEDEEATHEYRLLFEHITREALDEDASRELIARTAQERWGAPTA